MTVYFKKNEPSLMRGIKRKEKQGKGYKYKSPQCYEVRATRKPRVPPAPAGSAKKRDAERHSNS